ncbi:pyrroloquinoline quinone biosynthesis protein PqqB [Zoogloea dura]|uniref:Coenzyme PQQ synthesis protein B n=1 Tax=Zoogloea dura TaxID=2728840 RepID=A0A848GBS5_9RHOO|nr:pyrroloquinoline quinone biosynthesis protein PqqB [Zoogloea dura]NML27853.1 pyrroloquinoline quinone biosynthesis protein PqqB [Zoogloea dura]
MYIRVLGSAAGGGFPQWNCNCPNCRQVRAGSPHHQRRTQSSIAVSGDGVRWTLVNASPDILQQFQLFPGTWPKEGLRGCGIESIVLVDAQIDHTTGLYMLREKGSPWPVWCTDPVFEDLTRGNPILHLLEHYCGVARRELPGNGASFHPEGSESLDWRALPLLSAAPPYSPHRNSPVPGDNVGLLIRDPASGKRVFYAPGLAEVDDAVFDAMAGADCVMVDGTFWTDDEMIALGLSSKRARDIGHLAQSGPGGMIEQLSRLPRHVRRVLIHINNTNPILDDSSAQRAILAAAGIEVAFDGMEIAL